ncbi:MAG: PQQ-like beta-propeller repeat protein [Planctomycetes bacterium]|nr:PQQ-like beta-propeller repeat protein [Planctomycetota bacterium]
MKWKANRNRIVAGLCCLAAPLVLLPALRADGANAPPLVIAGESDRTAHRLAEADKLAAAGQWSDALEEYQHIIEENGDDLVPWDADKSHCLQARWLCHLRLARTAPDTLRLYRDRVDAQAAKWLTQGEADRDPRLLRRVVEDAFCSRSGDRALDLLGNLAFERGDFVAAERWWRLLALPPSQAALDLQAPVANHPPPTGTDLSSLILVFPDPQVDLARVRAKQILARLFRGERQDLEEELAAFRTLHGKAEGFFAGRQGNLAGILQDLAGPDSSLAPPDQDSWTTFAGDPSRNHVPPAPPVSLQWHASLADSWPQQLGPENRFTVPETSGNAARSLPFHPVLAGGQVLVADARYVTAFDLKTGRRTLWYDLLKDGRNGGLNLNLSLPAPADLSYTLTVADDRVYVRMGAQAIAPWKEGLPRGESDSFLVSLNLRPDRNGNRQRWLVKKPLVDRRKAAEFFEGSPVVSGGRVYLAATRYADGSLTTAVECYDADTGAPCWRGPVDLCESRGFPEAERRYRHHLLTLAGPNVVYCSHTGAIVALEAATGRRLWAVRYPSRGARTAEGEPSPRDLAPCLFAANRLLAAPGDYDRLLCLDPDTGRTLWQGEPPVEVVHLLGVAEGKLIFTTPSDIRAVDVATGRTLRHWMQPNDGTSRLPPFGRGLLAGHLVFWPTRQGLRVLNLESGEPAEEWYPFQLSRERLGNLALAHGCLVVAGARDLWVYGPESGRLSERLP